MTLYIYIYENTLRIFLNFFLLFRKKNSLFEFSVCPFVCSVLHIPNRLQERKDDMFLNGPNILSDNLAATRQMPSQERILKNVYIFYILYLLIKGFLLISCIIYSFSRFVLFCRYLFLSLSLSLCLSLSLSLSLSFCLSPSLSPSLSFCHGLLLPSYSPSASSICFQGSVHITGQ